MKSKMPKTSFWEKNHKNSFKAEFLETLVPVYGESPNPIIELYRQVANMYFQLFNNGCVFSNGKPKVKLTKEIYCPKLTGFLRGGLNAYKQMSLDEKCAYFDRIMNQVVEKCYDKLIVKVRHALNLPEQESGFLHDYTDTDTSTESTDENTEELTG